MAMNPISLHELMCAVLGLDPDDDDNDDWGKLEDLLFVKYEMDIQQFEKVACDLLKLTPVVEAGVSGKKYNAFVRGNVMIAKIEAET